MFCYTLFLNCWKLWQTKNITSFLDLSFYYQRFEQKFKSKSFLIKFNFCFKIIFITVTWYFDDICNYNKFQLPNYESIHQNRKTRKISKFISIFIQKDRIYDFKNNWINDDNTNSWCIEMIDKIQKIFFSKRMAGTNLKKMRSLETFLMVLLNRKKAR